jgi:opacity protein-like surface antigen
LANAYYDIGGLGRWRPYIGGGLGFSVNEVERLHQTSYATCPTAGCLNPTPEGTDPVRSGLHYTYTLAAQLTAGVSYQVWDNTHLDINYRYLFVGGTDQSMWVNGRNSTVEIDDQHEHYLRAGLRWDIN